MRLINADALINALNSQDLADWLSEQDEYTPASVVKHALETLHTVDAIPVEWIKRWSKKPVTEKDTKLAEQCEWNILEWLIADWAERKEE